ncbi:hypothetical membrane protein [Pelotomaculum thermopropionicum SI]|uniref:Hypothetical membrane protein n=1 Tax=Pelotomaculum thermopropionicum (strain DSM 13744 / JCM 10971 / SI) TaxID=370438 RepID=A5D131_PELTS|nr:hypothetical membrane protein [Pelotomaculum thermopropionicum SI]
MKRVIFAVLAGLLLTGAAGCGNKAQPPPQQQAQKVPLSLRHSYNDCALFGEPAGYGHSQPFAASGQHIFLLPSAG